MDNLVQVYFNKILGVVWGGGSLLYVLLTYSIQLGVVCWSSER